MRFPPASAAAYFRLDGAPFAGLRGEGVRIAVVDSGVQSEHPHLEAGAVVGGAVVVPDADAGAVRVIGDTGAWGDAIGHGTAVAAAIHEKAPAASLWAVRVFVRRLATSVPVLARGVEHAAEAGARLINLSLGTPDPSQIALLQDAVARAREAGALVVAALADAGAPRYPGALDGVVGVLADPALARDALRVELVGGRVTFHASPLPRPIPGVPPERNLSGISFAVANVTGFLARLPADAPADPEALGRALLEAGATTTGPTLSL